MISSSVISSTVRLVTFTSFGIDDILTMHKGKNVEVMLASGEKLRGTVGVVTLRILHLKQLTGKDYYNAAIRIKDVTAVIYRARGK